MIENQPETLTLSSYLFECYGQVHVSFLYLTSVFYNLINLLFLRCISAMEMPHFHGIPLTRIYHDKFYYMKLNVSTMRIRKSLIHCLMIHGNIQLTHNYTHTHIYINIYKLYLYHWSLSMAQQSVSIAQLVGLYSALECQANVPRSIHSSGELDALRRPTTCSDLVGIVDWGSVLFTSLRIWHLCGSTILRSRRLIQVMPICHQCQLSKLSLNISIHSKSYPSISRYKHYASRQLLPCTFT